MEVRTASAERGRKGWWELECVADGTAAAAAVAVESAASGGGR